MAAPPSWQSIKCYQPAIDRPVLMKSGTQTTQDKHAEFRKTTACPRLLSKVGSPASQMTFSKVGFCQVGTETAIFSRKKRLRSLTAIVIDEHRSKTAKITKGGSEWS
jgi:hypothetical protein